MGAGNYKSNPSSRGIKLQRKRTSQGKKKGGGWEGVQEAERIPVRSGHRSWKAAEVTQRKQASEQKSPPKEEEGLLGARLASFGGS